MRNTLNSLAATLLLVSTQGFCSDGATLLEECSEIIQFAETGVLDDSSVGASFCMGMVNGMLGLNAIYSAQANQRALFCPPKTTVSNAEGARIVVNYLRANPNLLDKDAVSLMFFAFQDAYPCP
jgi:hypothetical protein